MVTSEDTYRAIRIGDPSDWRLVMVLSSGGIEAYLRNVEDPMAGVSVFLQEEWSADGTPLLEKIENAVYDHPQLLDDFSADIALVTPTALWAPESVVDSDSDPAVKIFNSVYAADEEDVMCDYQDGRVCIYSLTPGVKGFLQRTFAGARIRCHQTVLVKRLGDRGSDMPVVYVNIRAGWADFVAVDGKKLLMAVTHDWHDTEDIRYRLFNLLDVYGLDPASVQVSLSGLKEEKGILLRGLRDRVAYVMMTMVPGIATQAGMSLTAALLMRGEL